MANVDRYRWRPGCFVGQAIEPTVEGVLGGFGSVSPADLRESDAFITKVIPACHRIAKLSGCMAAPADM